MHYEYPKGTCDALIADTEERISHSSDLKDISSLRNTLLMLRQVKPYADNKDSTKCGVIMTRIIDERKELQRKLEHCSDRDMMMLRIFGNIVD